MEGAKAEKIQRYKYLGLIINLHCKIGEEIVCVCVYQFYNKVVFFFTKVHNKGKQNQFVVYYL